MSFESFLGFLADTFSNVPIYVPIIAFVANLLITVLNRDYLWSIPVFAFFFGIVKTIYDIFKLTPGEDIIEQFNNYFSIAQYNQNLYYIYIPFFLYCFLFTIIFSYVLRHKKRVRKLKL